MRATERMISSRNVDTRGSAGQGKTSRSRAALLGMVLMFALTAASGWAQGQACPASPNFTPDFSANGSCLALNGIPLLPTFVPNGNSVALQITSSDSSQTGSAWYVKPQAVQNGFTTTFQFQFTNATTPPADGIAFLIQNSGTTAIGFAGNGGAMGYGDE